MQAQVSNVIKFKTRQPSAAIYPTSVWLQALTRLAALNTFRLYAEDITGLVISYVEIYNSSPQDIVDIITYAEDSIAGLITKHEFFRRTSEILQSDEEAATLCSRFESILKRIYG